MWGWKHHHSYEWSWGYQCQYRIPKSFCTHFEIWIHPFLLDCPKLYFIYDLNILPPRSFFFNIIWYKFQALFACGLFPQISFLYTPILAFRAHSQLENTSPHFLLFFPFHIANYNITWCLRMVCRV